MGKYSPAILAEKLLITDPSKIIVERSQPLGSGHNASVFKGYYRKTPVAVKIFKQSGTSISQRTLEAMFMREVGLMSTVRHTNLCEIQAAAICGNELMLVMEQMQTSLKDFISDYSKPFPFELKKKIAIDICRGMYALHENDPPILHCDLKVANVLLGPSGAKLTDFGILRLSIMDRPSTYSFPIRDKIEHLSTYISNDDVRKTIQKCCENDPNQRFQSFSDVIDDIAH